jgi:hypothetical protein
MKPKSEKSVELYNMMIRRGYPEPFCDEVTRNLNTDWTAQRMMGYLSHYKKLRLEEVADEMLAILSDRNRIMQKKEMESSNARWNDYLNNGFDDIEAVDDFID